MNFASKLSLFILKVISILIGFTSEVEILYYIAYGIFAALGVFIHPFFFAFHMTEILIIFRTL